MSEIQTATESTQASTPEQVEQDIQALEWRDFQLLGIAVLILLVIAAGFLALLMPQIIRKAEAQLANRQEFTSLFFGLIGLLVLLNIYMFDQRLRLQKARRELIHQLQRAERMARIDPLTGIPNRRSLKESLEAEISRSQRTKLPLTVMVSDVDNFKSFNTRFGHLTGDRVLIDVASLLRKNFRAGDFIVRYGGDEFVVVMPDTDIERARAAVERLNRLIDAWNMLQSTLRLHPRPDLWPYRICRRRHGRRVNTGGGSGYVCPEIGHLFLNSPSDRRDHARRGESGSELRTVQDPLAASPWVRHSKLSNYR